MAAEIGPQHTVSTITAENLARCSGSARSAFAANTAHAAEVDRLLDWMKGLKFLTQDGGHELPRNLVCGRTLKGAIEPDEVLRSAFAPTRAVLSAHYTDTGLAFFVLRSWAACRRS